MKTTQILKAMLIGITAGAAIFFVPFPFRFFFAFFFIFLAFRFFARGSWRRRYRHGTFERNHFWNPSYTQRWQSMSEEDRKRFIQKMEKELFSETATL